MNAITSNDEEWGGKMKGETSIRSFKSFIQGNQLVDLGYIGKPWTWETSWGEVGEIKEGLDRCLCTNTCWCRYDKAICKHIENEASDYAMLLLDLYPDVRKKKRRFCFDSRWLEHLEVSKVVGEAWERNKTGSRGFILNQKIKETRMSLLKWNKTLNLNKTKDILRLKFEI